MKYYISIQYHPNNNQKIIFPIPAPFVWYGSSSEYDKKLKKEFTITGDTDVGNAVDKLIEFCNQLVVEAMISPDYRIEVTK